MLIIHTSWCQAPVDGKGPALLEASPTREVLGLVTIDYGKGPALLAVSPTREVLGLVTMDDLEQIFLC